MECEDIRRRLDEYIDRECSEDVRQALASHLKTCPDCAREYEQRLALQAALQRLPGEELPFDFTDALNARLAQEQSKRPVKKPLYKRTWVRVLGACACLLLVVGLGTAVGRVFFGSYGASAPVDQMAMEEGSYVRGVDDYAETALLADRGASADYAEAEEALPEEAPNSSHSLSKGADSAESAQRKIIRNWSLSLRVDDFDRAMSSIEELADAYGGYVVSSSAYSSSDNSYRSGDISIRVQAAQTDAAVAEISELGKVESSYSDAQDVTADYYDLSARLEAYRTQEARLLELYQRANTVDEVLSVEDELASTQAEIESLQGMLNYYDQVTALSLINISLYASGAYAQMVEPQGFAGFGQKLSSGFLNGLNNTLDVLANIFVSLVSILPLLIILGLVVWLLIFLIKRHKKKQKA